MKPDLLGSPLSGSLGSAQTPSVRFALKKSTSKPAGMSLSTASSSTMNSIGDQQ